MTDARDEEFMRRALALAERAWGQTAPNPMVGAVVALDGEIVGEGYHERFGEAHAEVNALAAAGELARGATLYVTLEPCNHWGKTPPCADAVIAAGISRVVIGASDPGSESGGGAQHLRNAGMDVDTGLLGAEVRELNAAFFHSFASDRPWIILKLATSIDGAISDYTRQKGWITGAESLAAVHRLRAGVDAIGVGAGTYIADSPALTARGSIQPRVQPLRVVFDRNSRLTSSRTIVRNPPDLVLTSDDLGTALRELTALGVRSLLVEGGAALASSLLDAEVVDRLVIFQAPIVLGRDALNAFAFAEPRTIDGARRLTVLERAVLGADTMTTYALSAV